MKDNVTPSKSLNILNIRTELMKFNSNSEIFYIISKNKEF